MSAAEFGRWLDFFQRYGRCGPVRMYDHGFALLAWKIDHAISSNATSTIADYLQYRPATSDAEPSPEDILNELIGRK